MNDLKVLEKKVSQLEKRLEQIEAALAAPADTEENQLMEALYQKAKELVIRYHKSSPIFLQRKLLIDYERAEKLLDRLRVNGILEPESGTEA